MSSIIETILAQVRALTEAERAELIDRLMAEERPDDVDSPEAIKAAWIAEASRRAEEIASGRVQPIPWEDVRREMREKYGIPG